MFQTKVIEKITLGSAIFNFENRAGYEIMWKNIVKPDGSQMTIWRRRIAWWITKATNALSEFVILSAYPLIQCWHERASILRYMHIACIVHTRTLNLYHILHSKLNSYFADSEDSSLFRYYVTYTGK